MEDILASIRRILSEDETQAAAGKVPETSLSPGPVAQTGSAPQPSPPPRPGEERAEDVLVLHPGMMVPDADAPGTAAAGAEALASHSSTIRGAMSQTSQSGADPTQVPPSDPSLARPELGQAAVGSSPELALDQGPLVDAQTRLAAASSVGNLVRTLTAGRAAAVYRGGPTIEDMVRELLRPLLKEWLESHLPPLVERLVSAEIERVVRNSGL